jgi:hypothetical protein
MVRLIPSRYGVVSPPRKGRLYLLPSTTNGFAHCTPPPPPRVLGARLAPLSEEAASKVGRVDKVTNLVSEDEVTGPVEGSSAPSPLVGNGDEPEVNPFPNLLLNTRNLRILEPQGNPCCEAPIPLLHFYWREACAARVVPKQWASLPASGDERTVLVHDELSISSRTILYLFP